MRITQLLYSQNKNENILSVYAGLRKNSPKILCSSIENLSKIAHCIYICLYIMRVHFLENSLLALYPIFLLLKCAIYFNEIHKNVQIYIMYIFCNFMYFSFVIFIEAVRIYVTLHNWDATKPLFFYRIHDCDVTTCYCIHAELTAS